MTKPNNRGVALIAAVVTAVIFMMLVVTVVIISMSTYKKSGQNHDRAMALNLAEAGINETLYRMNYRHYSESPPNATYPTNNQYLNFNYVPGPADTLWQDLLPAPYDPFNVGAGNGYIVQFLANGILPNDDELVATGIYNNKRRVILINIRGKNDVLLPAPLNSPTHGIAEAFNKHAVYARTVTYGNVTTDNGTITGNIISTNNLLLVPIPGENTKTIDTNFLLPIPDISRYQPFSPVPAAWTIICQDDDGSPPYVYAAGASPLTEAELNASGITYPGSDVYIATSSSIGANKWLFKRAATAGAQNGSVTLTGTTSLAAGGFVESEGSIILNNVSVTISNGVLKAAGGITINPATTSAIGSLGNSNNILYASGAIDIANNQTVNGNIAAGGDVILKGGAFKGTIISGGTITLRDNACTVNPPDNIAIIAYNTTTATAVNLSGNVTHNITGLVYVGSGGGTGNLTFGTLGNNNTSIINGTVVVRDTLSMAYATPNSRITWNSSNFRNFVGYPDVYSNFPNGRRIYLPVPGSWREK